MNFFDEKIEKSQNICILGHQNPDGDCIGSTLAIYNYIKKIYGDKKIVKPFLTEFSSKFKVLKNADKISNDKNDGTIFDLCIVVDSSSKERFADFARYFDDAKDTIVFDHHENNTVPAKTSVLFPESIATCEILYNFLDKQYFDKDIAMCLYLGIATDSGVFRYKATTKKTLSIAGDLISYGFDFTSLLDQIVFDNSVAQRKAQGIAFERLVTMCEGKVVFSYLNDDDLNTLNIKKTDIDNVIVYLREISDIEIAAFAYQVGTKIFKISLRSKCDDLNVSDFARAHDGGGHAQASGCMYYGDIEKVRKSLEEDLSEFIKKRKNNK